MPAKDDVKPRVIGNLSVIPTNSGGTASDESNGNRRTTSYIEYNDGKVCWYYPIFPEFYGANGGGNYSCEGGATSNASLLRFSNDHEEYFYDDADSLTNQSLGEYPSQSSQCNRWSSGNSNWPLNSVEGSFIAENGQQLEDNMNNLQQSTNQHVYDSSLLYAAQQETVSTVDGRGWNYNRN